jgi:MOSC domain-containing protein
MNACVANIWRYPLKSHGRESVGSVTLSQDEALPWDRVWAVTHEASRFDPSNPSWQSCANFSIGAKNPALMAITARLDESSRTLWLSHPDRPDFSFRPDDKADAWRFLDWLEPLNAPDRARPTGIVTVPGRAMTDTDYASISILSLNSLQALSKKAGQALSPDRFRGNIWLGDLPAWQEFDLLGKEICIGKTRLRVAERIRRCRATTANPTTGKIDVDTMALLNAEWGHQDFGIYAQVIEGGKIRIGDALEPGAV